MKRWWHLMTGKWEQLLKLFHLALFQNIYLLFVDCVLVFLQEACTLVLHLGTNDQVTECSLTKRAKVIFIVQGMKILLVPFNRTGREFWLSRLTMFSHLTVGSLYKKTLVIHPSLHFPHCLLCANRHLEPVPTHTVETNLNTGRKSMQIHAEHVNSTQM